MPFKIIVNSCCQIFRIAKASTELLSSISKMATSVSHTKKAVALILYRMTSMHK